MTTAEKVSLLSGSDVWRTAAVERLNIPTVKVSDGPNGVRGDSTTGARAVCLPASIGVAASFDVDLVGELGRLLGRETTRKGAHILLAPTINMARHPLGGRNFESFGEDPILTSAMARAYIRGVQDEGVGACAKHFVANDVEEARLTVSSEVDPVTLREVYLAPFEAAVEVGVWSVMAAYPKLIGEHCTENRWLLTTLLREEWGFDGLVMSDWGATHHPTRSVAAGLDLEMPGPPLALGPKLEAAVEAGDLAMSVLDERAATMVDLTLRADLLGVAEEPERSVDLPAERTLVRQAAVDGMVLLTNSPAAARSSEGAAGDDNDNPVPMLPLSGDVASIAVIGPNADPGVIQGGGSAQLVPHHSVSPLEGLRAALAAATITHRSGCLADRYVPRPATDVWVAPESGTAPLAVEIFANPDLAGEPAVRRDSRNIFAFYQGRNPFVADAELWSQRWTGRLSVANGGQHRFGILAVGRCRVLVDGEVIADNWTDPQPGQAFFEKASAEVVGSVDLEAGTDVEVVVEWSGGEDEQLEGLRFGIQFPIDEDAMMADAVSAASEADVAVVVVGLTAEWETESHDRLMFGLPGRQDELVRSVVAANPRTVVVVNAGGPLDMPWLDDVPATLMAWYPGQEFGAALADVLLGESDPGGRLPVTFPKRLEDAPTNGTVPGDGKQLHYGEGLFIGHRWYAEHDIEPLLPFGHGRSYTEFQIGPPTSLDPSATSETENVQRRAVAVPVTNVGDRAGKCVLQAYLDPQLPGRPRVLAGFASCRLAPGEHSTVTLPLDPYAFRTWNATQDCWEPLGGTHRLEIATSATDVAHSIQLP